MPWGVFYFYRFLIAFIPLALYSTHQSHFLTFTIMNAAVIGASGYSGEELVRLLARHPDVTLAAVTSRSIAGKPVADVMP